MKITITGISGFVGRNLGEFLENSGHSVEGLSLRDAKWSLNKNSDALIHLAGKAHDTANVSKDSAYFEVNTELTKKLFDAFLKSDIRDFVFFSSVKAAADSVAGILDEEHLPEPKTAYGKSKLAAEEYLLSCDLPVGKRVFILRPCMIHGPGNKGNLNLLYKIVEKGLPWPLAAFHNQRSFLSTDNLNFLVLKLLESSAVPSGIYNLADDRPLSTNEVVQIIAEVSGKKSRLWSFSPKIINIIAKMGNKTGLPLNSERLRKLTENYVVSNAKIKSVLTLKELPQTAENGLRKTIKSFNN